MDMITEVDMTPPEVIYVFKLLRDEDPIERYRYLEPKSKAYINPLESIGRR